MTPQELSAFLNKKKITLTEYSRISSVPLYELSRQLKKFGVVAYRLPKKIKVEYLCKLCGKSFEAYDRPSRANRNNYCTVDCAKRARRKAFDDKRFRIRDYHFTDPAKNLGNYQCVELGERQRSFVNRNKVKHFFFRDGIQDEETAYVYGVLLADGSIYRNKKGTYIVKLQMTDADIVEKISNVLENKNRLSASATRRTLTLSITSPYLFNDLLALGCVPGKTELANYPSIREDLDRHLIRGIIDGDGSWVLKGRLLMLQICGNDLLMYGIHKRISTHLKISPQAAQYPVEFDSRIKMKSFCHIRYNTTDSLAIRDWIYEGAQLYGRRKYDRAYSVRLPYTEQFTTRRLAGYLGVSTDFVKKSIKKHCLPSKQIGPYYYFEEADLPTWIEFLRTKLVSPNCRLENRGELTKKWL